MLFIVIFIHLFILNVIIQNEKLSKKKKKCIVVLENEKGSIGSEVLSAAIQKFIFHVFSCPLSMASHGCHGWMPNSRKKKKKEMERERKKEKTRRAEKHAYPTNPQKEKKNRIKRKQNMTFISFNHEIRIILASRRRNQR